MDKIGEILRQERQKRNISIEELSKKTNLNKRYIIALENDNIDEISGKFYYYNYLKTCLNVLNIDYNDFCKKYEVILNSINDHYNEPIDRIVKSLKVKKFKRYKYLKVLILLFFIFLIFYIIYSTGFYKKIVYYFKSSEYIRNPNLASLIIIDKKLMNKLVNDYSCDYYPFNVKLLFKNGCWIRVRKNNIIVDEGIYSNNVEKVYLGYNIRILISNPLNVEVFINNKKFNFPNNVKKYYSLIINVNTEENVNQKWLY